MMIYLIIKFVHILINKIMKILFKIKKIKILRKYIMVL
jgi:hypothetical protein